VFRSLSYIYSLLKGNSLLPLTLPGIINIHQQESPGKFKIDMMHHVLLMAIVAHGNFREIPKS